MSLEPAFMPTDIARERINVHPQPKAEETAEPTRARKSFQKATLGDNNKANWGGDGFGFDDFLDLINPLQHIPGVNHVYRELTGDEIAQEAKVLGGGLFGGPIGLAAASINAMIQQESGADIGEHVMALVNGEPDVAEVAQATPLKPLPQLAQAAQRPAITPPAVSIPLNLPAPKPAQTDSTANKDTIGYTPVNAVQEPIDALPQPERDKHDMILELFGPGVASAHEDYQKAQLMSHVMSVTAKMTA